MSSRQVRARLRPPLLATLALGMLVALPGCGSRNPQPSAAAAPRDSVATAALEAERGAAVEGRERTVGVPPFSVAVSDSSLSALGYALADLLTTDLARSARLTLVERSRLGEVLREIELGTGDRMDSSSVPRAGRLLRAQQLLLGGVEALPDGQLRLSVRIADVETGVIQQAIDGRAPLRDILEAEKAVAFRLFEALGVILTPAERVAIEDRRTPDLDALLAYGRGVRAEMGGDTRRAADEFRRAAVLDAGFTAAAGRALNARSAATGPTGSVNSMTPGASARSTASPVEGVVDRLNRPLDLITNYARPTPGPGDPAFPGTTVTVVIVIRRP
ncbi:MAG: CsgG/HfaB family protein [Gemmatimonadota bacterium]